MTAQRFSLVSPAFEPDTHLPSAHTCEGDDVSPELTWMHPPAGTASYVIVMEDLDADDGPVTHWLLYDIPGDREGLAAGVHAIGKGGRNDRHHLRYSGPCPPPNHGQHRYLFSLRALDTGSLGLDEGATRDEVERTAEGHELGRAEIMVRYHRAAGRQHP